MRILLTGTAGQIGGALLPLLQGHGEILAPTSEDFDLSKPALLADGLDRLKPELIINPAAYTAVDRAEDETELAFSINAEAPSRIAGWAAFTRFRWFISRPTMFSADRVTNRGGRTASRRRFLSTAQANSPVKTRFKPQMGLT